MQEEWPAGDCLGVVISTVELVSRFAKQVDSCATRRSPVLATH